MVIANSEHSSLAAVQSLPPSYNPSYNRHSRSTIEIGTSQPSDDVRYIGIQTLSLWAIIGRSNYIYCSIPPHDIASLLSTCSHKGLVYDPASSWRLLYVAYSLSLQECLRLTNVIS